MVTKRYLKDSEYKTLTGYFEYIEHYYNANEIGKAFSLIIELSKAQIELFSEWLDIDAQNNVSLQEYALNLLKEDKTKHQLIELYT